MSDFFLFEIESADKANRHIEKAFTSTVIEQTEQI